MRRRSIPSQGGRWRGFTLVELLVAIGIIALLISILLPSLRKARRAAETVQCLSNQRQLLAACIAFSNDMRSRLPFTGWQSNDAANWLYFGKAMKGIQSEVRQGQLWKYLRDYRCYRCPGDRGPWPPGHAENLTSYVMNGSASAFSQNGNESLSILRFKPDDVLFWEIPMTFGTAGTYNDGTNYPNEGITARHKGGTTVGHIDGHADVMPAEEFVKWCGYGPTVLWCDPTAKDGGWSKISGKPNPVPVQE
jgi:prepilin-type N-terminal cleavage/methylation domain-containing protein